jgi:predicted AlkP superfamily phosphohydrolase/phosphomutase
MEKRIVVLGIDGAELDLLHHWTQEGALPNFEILLKKGISGKMKSTMPPITPCAWPSLFTGKNPGKHGQFDFFTLDEKKELRINWEEYRTEKTVWRILSDHGKKCCVMNVPFTYPPDIINGILISGFLTPDKNSRFAYPPSIKKEILDEFPDFRLAEQSRFTNRAADKKQYITDIVELTRLQGKVAAYLYKKDAWDFFMAAFMGADHAQHHYWKYMDTMHPAYEKDVHLKDAIYKVYCELDTIVGTFLDIITDNTILFVVSDHGFGTYEKDVNLNKVLKSAGYLTLKSSIPVALKSVALHLGIETSRIIPFLLKAGLVGLSKKHPEKRRGKTLDKISYTWKDIDWEKTKAYSFGYYGTIYICDQDNYEEIRKGIAEVLLNLNDNNGAVVDDIFFKENIYHGQKLDICPDIVFPMKNFSYAASNMFVFPSKKLFSSPKTLQSGGHRLGATFIVFTRNTDKGEKIEGVNIIDVAPTILTLLGIEPPSDMDGNCVINASGTDVVNTL